MAPVALAIAAGASLTGAPAHAAVIVSDTFTLNDSDRQAGDGLDGTQTEVGGATWAANGSLVFTTDGDISSNATGSVRVATVAIGGPGALDDIVSVKVDLNPAGAGNAAVGFTSNHGNFNNDDFTNLWVTFSNGGTVTLRQNGDSALDQHNIAGESYFFASQLNTVEIIVNRQASKVDVVVNGTTVIDDFDVTLSSGAYLNRAGFMITNPGTAGTPRVDNFEVSSVPEPASLGLMGLGLMLLTPRRREQSA
jgi:hypothetical protein